ELAAMLRAKGLNADHRHEVSSDQDLLALLEANIGIGFLPRTVSTPPSLPRAAVGGLLLDRTVCLYGVAGRQRTPIASTFRKMLRAAIWPNRTNSLLQRLDELYDRHPLAVVGVDEAGLDTS